MPVIAPYAKPYFPANTGAPLNAGKLYTYITGTSTLKTTYKYSSGTAHTNPIILDARGEPPDDSGIYLDSDVAYRFVLKDSADAEIWTRDGITPKIDAAQLYGVAPIQVATVAAMKALTGLADGAVIVTIDNATLGGGGGGRYRYYSTPPGTQDNFIYHNQTTGGGQFKLLDTGVLDARLAGLAADGSTDQTSGLVTAAATVKTILIPYNMKFNRRTLINDMPVDAVFFDFSVVNDFSAAGETSKHVGIISGDEAVNDTHWSLDNGHHVIATLNNFGTSGSTSGDERKASVLWASGFYQLGATNKRGFRGAAIQQFTKSTGATYWTWGIRSLAPWAAIAADYEFWASGQSISGAGVYRTTGDNHYVSAGAGTTGATEPTHTSGTVSDGGVSWTWVDSADRSLIQLDQYNRLQLGSGPLTDTFNQKVNGTDPTGGNYSFVGRATGTSKTATLKLTPTDSGAAESAQPFISVNATDGFRVMKSDGSTFLATFSDAAGQIVKEIAFFHGTAADADTTPSVNGVSTLYLSNTGATSITALDDGNDNQMVRLIATNGNTTLVHSATLMLTGSANQTLTAYSSITFQKVPNAISDRWIEVARSIK